MTPPEADAAIAQALSDDVESDVRRPGSDRLVAEVALVVTLVPALGVLVALAEVSLGASSWGEICLLAGMYGLTLIGVEVGFHRVICHRGASAGPAVRFLLAVLGSMTAEGPIAWWVATHRRHHERSDRMGDPHSPHLIDGKPTTHLRGFLHAHIGWMYMSTTRVDWSRYARDVSRDATLMWVHRTYFVWVLLGLLLPGAVGWLWFGNAYGGLRGVLWGGLVRMFLVHNAMWCVASVCHLYGRRPYRSSPHDLSRNNAWIAIPTFGESWHNNHHAFPTSVRHGLEWWQIDINYLVIRALSALGLLRDIKVPTAAMKAAKRQDADT